MRNNYQQNEDSITRISRSKSRNQMSIVSKLKEKENGWNDRFHLEHIPEYNYQNEPHMQYLKNKFRIPNRRNDPSRAKRMHEPSLQKNKVSNKPNPRRNEEKLKEAINKAYSDLKNLWYERAIPECHMQCMTKLFNRQNNPVKILEDIKRQFSQVDKETSQVQKIASSIATRENCLEKIQELEAQLQSDFEGNRNRVSKLFEEKVSHLRILTIHCIQCIFQWKQLIQSFGPKWFKVKYVHQGKLYTIKVKEDYQKIASSKFGEIYKFQHNKVDAFFLNYTCEGKKISNVSKNLIKRIRLCEIMLHEDEEQEQETKKTPKIEKIRSPPKYTQSRDKSMPPRGKSSVMVPWTKVPLQYGQFTDYFNSLLNKSVYGSSFLPVIEMRRYEEYTILRFTETEEEIVLGVDRFSSQRKIILLGIKSNRESFENLLKNFCEYIWEHDYCNEIRVSLVHQKQNGMNGSVDVELEKKLKSVGFRWVSINHSNETTLTIYRMKRPLDTCAHKTSRRTQTYPVIIEHLVHLNLRQCNEKKHPNRCFASVIDLLQFIEENKAETFEEICKREEFSHALNCMGKISEFMIKQAQREGIKDNIEKRFTYSGLKSFDVGNHEDAEKIFRDVEITSKKIRPPTFMSLLNTSYKFNHITINDGKFTKFFPAKDSQILIVESNYPIYLLQTDEQNISFFVIEVDENFSMDSIESIFNGMGEQSSFIDEFWLPTFYKSEDYVDESGLFNTDLVSTNYRNSLGSLSRKSKVRTKIIKAPFVFGMINKKLLQILQIPFYSTLVKKQDLV